MAPRACTPSSPNRYSPADSRMRPITAAALLLATLVPGSEALGQAFLPEDNLAYPVRIEVPGGGGTGFFVRREREIFLVTARHVLFDITNGQLVRVN